MKSQGEEHHVQVRHHPRTRGSTLNAVGVAPWIRDRAMLPGYASLAGPFGDRWRRAR